MLRHEHQLSNLLLPLHAVLAGSVLLLFGDTLSVVFAGLFFGVLRGQCGRPFYFILGVLVCYVELVGTSLGCWVWEAQPFSLLRTTNPPASAYACYAIADFIALGCALLVASCWRQVAGSHKDAVPCESCHANHEPSLRRRKNARRVLKRCAMGLRHGFEDVISSSGYAKRLEEPQRQYPQLNQRR